MLRRGLLQLMIMPFPWRVRRWLLASLFKYDIDISARIGLSIVLPRVRLSLGAGSSIGHMTLIRGMDTLLMDVDTRIGHLNWVYAISSSDPRLAHEPGRRAELVMGPGAQITSRHIIDCSNTVHLGRRAAIVGYRTQILTHGLSTARVPGVHTKPIHIADYALVATGCIVLGGARLPEYSALGAGSTLRNSFSDTYSLYSGVPARLVAAIPANSPFFGGSAQSQPDGEPGARPDDTQPWVT